MKERQGKAWSSQEESELKESFLAGMPPAKLADRHQRSIKAINKRLQRIGVLEEDSTVEPELAPLDNGIETNIVELPSKQSKPRPAHSGGTTRAQLPKLASESKPVPLVECIDQLIFRLQAIREKAAQGQSEKETAKAVTNVIEQFDQALISSSHKSDPDDDNFDHPNDPLPDRLRSALLNAVKTCIRKKKNQDVAKYVLGLVGDGEHVTLAAIGRRWGVSRERVRQRRIRAFQCINSVLPRRVDSASRLRTVLEAISPDMNLADPVQMAPLVLKFASDKFSAAEQLTIMCCIAAGASFRDIRTVVKEAVIKAFQDAGKTDRWRLDRWADAAGKAIYTGPIEYYESPPAALIGRKRTPGESRESDAIVLASERLKRQVMCESGTELKVFSWLERSPEVCWYQEQPVAIPYTVEGRKKFYFPDVAVLDKSGKLIVVEVKPLFMMYRQETLTKAIAALKYLGQRGTGYLLTDARGRTLSDLSCIPYDPVAADEVESLFAEGPISFGAASNAFSRRSEKFDPEVFVSAVLNRDWAVSSESPVQVFKLPDGISFRPLLGTMLHGPLVDD